MSADAGVISFVLASCLGLGFSFGLERFARPRTAFIRSTGAWCAHAGLWWVLHALLTLVLGRPWFAAVLLLAFAFLVVMINNAKYKSLAEPFTSQDFRYLTEAIKHPRLYIPFLGWAKFIALVCAGGGAILAGWLGEPVPTNRFTLNGPLGMILVSLCLGGMLLWFSSRANRPCHQGSAGVDVARVEESGPGGPGGVRFEPAADVRASGLFATLWFYALAARRFPVLDAVFPTRSNKSLETSLLPNLVAVQSESFFDARELFDGIRPEVLANFDRLKAEAVLTGRMRVPAWGANTVRTEFSFLTGLDNHKLDAHRFNPFRAIANGWRVGSMAHWLKSLGYRTVCVHPYPISFYQRNKVYPALGFDEFIDITGFEGAERSGPYVSDAAVAAMVQKLLAEASQPVFVFAITMENHGPLHLEAVQPEDEACLYSRRPPSGCEDLTVYLRHLRNADRMLAALRETLTALPGPASLCWFGDHVPILPEVYARFGAPSGQVDFLVWHKPEPGCPPVVSDVQAAETSDLPVAQLSGFWLKTHSLGP